MSFTAIITAYVTTTTAVSSVSFRRKLLCCNFCRNNESRLDAQSNSNDRMASEVNTKIEPTSRTASGVNIATTPSGPNIRASPDKNIRTGRGSFLYALRVRSQRLRESATLGPRVSFYELKGISLCFRRIRTQPKGQMVAVLNPIPLSVFDVLERPHPIVELHIGVMGAVDDQDWTGNFGKR
jgi:hypothetical protein